MSFQDDHGPMEESDDILAAEYVVGALSAKERLEAAARVESDPAFARLVESWEARLSPLADGYPEIEPPAAAKEAIDRVLFGRGAAADSSTSAAHGGIWQSLNFWRGFAAASLALLLIAVAVPFFRQAPQTQEGTQFVASIAPKDSEVSYLAYYDPATENLSLSHVSGERGTGRDFELWAIEGQAKPISLGVIGAGKTIRVKVAPEIGGKLAKGGMLAISLEPAGGSPTGQPTGPVVAVGKLSRI
jgi:anti-sigma-K factor RskA